MSEPLEYRVLLECLDSLVTALKSDPASLAIELAAKSLIPPREVSYQRTNAEQARELADIILDRVKLAPNRYRDILDIFSRHEWMADFVHILQNTHEQLSERPGQEYAECHAAQNELALTCDEFSCDLDDIPHCKSSLKVSNDIVRFGDLDEDDLEDLYAQMNELTRKIDIEFEKFLNKVFKSFRDSKDVDRDSLVLTLTKREAFKEDELAGTKTVFDVFKTIKPYCSYFNYDVLETLVQVNGSHQAKGYLKDYLQAFSAYCKAMPCAEEIYGSEDTKSKRTKLKFKLDYDRQQLKPDAVRSIKCKIASHLEIRPSSLYLCRLKEGCVLLEFLVPTFIFECLFPLTVAQKIELYEDVKTLSVQYQTIQVNIKIDARRLLEAKKASKNEKEFVYPKVDERDMSGATLLKHPLAYTTTATEGPSAMSNFMGFPPAPIFGPPQYFGARGRPGKPISPFFVPTNQTYMLPEFSGYAGQYGNVPFSEIKPVVCEQQEIAVNALLSLKSTGSTSSTCPSTPTTMSATSVRTFGDETTPELLSALRMSTGAYTPGDSIQSFNMAKTSSTCMMDSQYSQDVKPIIPVLNYCNGSPTDVSTTWITSPVGRLVEQSPGSKPHRKSSNKSAIWQICGKSHAHPLVLKTRMRTHSYEKPYHCDVCGKAFTQAANLTAHMRTHSGEKPFSCPICNKKFSQSYSVTTHLHTHSEERPPQPSPNTRESTS